MYRLKTIVVSLLLLAGLAACSTGAPMPAIGDGEQPADIAAIQAARTAEAFAQAAERVTLTVETASADATEAALSSITEEPTPASPAAQPEGNSPMPVISAFDCDPCSITPGGAARLSWQASNAEAVLLDGRGVVAPGQEVVYPDQTTTYRLVATNAAGRSEKAVTVTVPDLPAIHFFTCLPCQLQPGDQATLSWDLSGGTAVYLDGEGVAAPGSLVVAPAKTTTYRLEAVSDHGSVTRLVTVTVLEGGTDQAVEETLTGFGISGVGSYGPVVCGWGIHPVGSDVGAGSGDVRFPDQRRAGLSGVPGAVR